MNSASKKAILVVSFGTSYENTRKLTIEAIEHDIADAFPACPTYRAWTIWVFCRTISIIEARSVLISLLAPVTPREDTT